MLVIKEVGKMTLFWGEIRASSHDGDLLVGTGGGIYLDSMVY